MSKSMECDTIDCATGEASSS